MLNPKHRSFSIIQWFIKTRPLLGSSAAHSTISYRGIIFAKLLLLLLLLLLLSIFESTKYFRVTVWIGLCECFLNFSAFINFNRTFHLLSRTSFILFYIRIFFDEKIHIYSYLILYFPLIRWEKYIQNFVFVCQ